MACGKLCIERGDVRRMTYMLLPSLPLLVLLQLLLLNEPASLQVQKYMFVDKTC